MKSCLSTRKPRFLFALVLCWAAWATPGLAQTAELRAPATGAILAAGGGELTLSASVRYEKKPSALGWAIELPPGWSLVRVAGASLPGIKPPAGTQGLLEFAYTSAPEAQASFDLVLSYPAGTTTGKVSGLVLVRAGGDLTTLEVAAEVVGR